MDCGCITEVDCNVFVLFGPRDAGCFKEVAVLCSDHLKQVPLSDMQSVSAGCDSEVHCNEALPTACLTLKSH